MKKIVFYEKTGCKGNARQKAMLEANGYTLVVKSILEEPWEKSSLRPFFGDLPVSDWFNWKAPAVKQGEIDPCSFLPEDALELMLREPILIRRPLIEINGRKACGFDSYVQTMLGLNTQAEGMEACQNSKERCD
ncbi:ArsC/Spx/MgsR family protein [Pontiellaceae bacterium B1224]|nr:ArsC/Spx/MgsR family protein [Pontiellaceae bacterium B1224]